MGGRQGDALGLGLHRQRLAVRARTEPPNREHARLHEAAVVRRQADQIYNLSLTRTATVTLGREG